MTLALIFTLGEEVYGLEIEAVQEIIEDPPLHYVPRAEGVLVGAVNFHGQVLAVIDLPALLGVSGQKRDHRRVVLAPQFKSLVLIVSSIQKIVNLDLSLLQPPPTKAGSSAIRGLATLDEHMVNMLDTQEVIKQLGNQAS
ncbi:MAG: chemotaxis protein CheW [Desulfuromonadales bacterium]